jgi:Lon protease-like protein
VSARLAELLPLSGASKQRLLEMDDARDRLEILRRLISSSGQ